MFNIKSETIYRLGCAGVNSFKTTQFSVRLPQGFSVDTTIADKHELVEQMDCRASTHFGEPVDAKQVQPGSVGREMGFIDRR